MEYLSTGPMPEFASFVAGLGERLAEVPRFKQVLHTHALDLGAPAWVDDVAFDLSHHVRPAAVPQPGDDAASDVNELATGIARAEPRLTSLSTTPRPSSAPEKRALGDDRLASDG